MKQFSIILMGINILFSGANLSCSVSPSENLKLNEPDNSLILSKKQVLLDEIISKYNNTNRLQKRSRGELIKSLNLLEVPELNEIIKGKKDIIECINIFTKEKLVTKDNHEKLEQNYNIKPIEINNSKNYNDNVRKKNTKQRISIVNICRPGDNNSLKNISNLAKDLGIYIKTYNYKLHSSETKQAKISFNENENHLKLWPFVPCFAFYVDGKYVDFLSASPKIINCFAKLCKVLNKKKIGLSKLYDPQILKNILNLLDCEMGLICYDNDKNYKKVLSENFLLKLYEKSLYKFEFSKLSSKKINDLCNIQGDYKLENKNWTLNQIHNYVYVDRDYFIKRYGKGMTQREKKKRV